MLDILKKMVDRGMPVRLNVAGIGEEMDNLKAQAKRLGIEDKVTFLGGVRDLTGYFKESRYFGEYAALRRRPRRRCRQ